MKSKLVALIVLGAAIAIAAKALAEDHRVKGKHAQIFSVVYLDDIEPRSEKARIKSIATKAYVATIQRDMAADPLLVGKLKARGVPLRHIIGRQRALNGNWVFYIR